MKKYLFVLLFICIAISSFSQDIMNFNNGISLKAKVIDLNDNNVSYKEYIRHSSIGALYSDEIKKISKEDLSSIQYENGNTEYFDYEVDDIESNDMSTNYLINKMLNLKSKKKDNNTESVNTESLISNMLYGTKSSEADINNDDIYNDDNYYYDTLSNSYDDIYYDTLSYLYDDIYNYDTMSYLEEEQVDYDSLINSFEYFDDVYDALYLKAMEAEENDSIDLAIHLYKKMIEKSKLYDANFMDAVEALAYIYGNKEDVVNMAAYVRYYRDFLELYPYESEYAERFYKLLEFQYAIRNSTAFEDDLCGIWVSDYSLDLSEETPYLILEISRNVDGIYSARINSASDIAKKHKMYDDAYDEYPISELAFSNGMSVSLDSLSASLSFKNEQYKGGSQFIAQVGTELTNTMAKGLLTNINLNTQDFMEGLLQGGMVRIGAGMLNVLFAQAAVTKQIANAFNIYVKESFKGAMTVCLVERQVVGSSNGKFEDYELPMTFMLYKMYPEYDFRFKGKNGEIVGYKRYSKSEADGLKENELSAYSVNDKSYQELCREVSFNYLFTENANAQKNLERAMNEKFKMARTGVLYGDKAYTNAIYRGYLFVSTNLEHGKGVIYFNEKEKELEKFEGTFVYGVKQGVGTYYYRNGNYSVCEYDNGKLNGKFVMFYAKGNKLESMYEDDKIVGISKLTSVEGDTLFVNWDKKGKLKSGVIKYADGARLEGTFKNYSCEGKGKIYYPNGDVLKGKWKNGEKHGIFKMTYNDGTVEKRRWKNGVQVK